MSKKLDNIINWLEDFKTKNNAKGVVLGLSGGKDSTVVAMLAKKVWGDNVVAVLMPNGAQKDIGDSIEIAEKLKLDYVIDNISIAFEALSQPIYYHNAVSGKVEITEKSKTNIAPRIRMTRLYAIAQSLGYLVIGTGNYSEYGIGWTTKFGDSACDFNPILHLTKTEVVEIGLELAEEFELDKKFIIKAPGDGLTGKTDEDNFGFTYEELDAYLLRGIEGPNIDKIKSMIASASHKKKMPASLLDEKYGKIEITDATIKKDLIVLSWVCRIGFGQLTAYRDKTGKWKIDTECLSKKFAHEVFKTWLDTMEVE